MTMAMAMRAKAAMGGTTLGRISRAMIRLLRAPRARDAVTNSRWENDNVAARVIRASAGMARIVKTRVTVPSVAFWVPGSDRKVTRARASTRAGKANMMSIAPMTTRS